MKFKKNILVFGGSGLLGKCLIENYSTRSKLHLFLNKKKIQSDKVKIVNPRNYHLIENYIKKNNIDTILNLAGLTSIELCQKNKKLSKKCNYILPIKLAKLSKKNNLKYVFISTDNFFFKTKKLNEDGKLKSVNTYSEHKRKSEKDIINIYPKSLIIRTNFYCIGNKKRKSFSDTIIDSIKSKTEIGLFKDVYYTPIYGKYLLKYIFALLNKDNHGIFNICSDEKISKFSFGKNLCSTFKLNRKYIKGIYLKKRKDLVKRPFNMAMSNQKLKKILNIKVPSIKHQLKDMKKDFRKLKNDSI
jgi:dTDP-4-dehydrorhamnose reductase